MGALIFEPHNGYGSNDPDGEPWPFGYISEGFGRPVFELQSVLQRPEEELTSFAWLFAGAPDLLAALDALLTAAEMTTFSDQYPAECEAARAAIAIANAKAEA